MPKMSTHFNPRSWRKMFLMSAAGLCLAGGGAQAGVTVAFDPGTTNTTTALTGFSTSGDEMAGMTITAYFSDNSSKTGTWAATGSQSGAASVSSWFRLSESGDTYFNSWTLANLSSLNLTRLVIDAGTGNTVFDTTFGGAEGTSGSSAGNSFSLDSGPNGINITATYRDAVALTGHNPVGDLYRRLDLAFTNNLAAGRSITFSADTDNLRFAGDIQAVPEPSSLAMAGVALLGAAGTAMRRKRA